MAENVEIANYWPNDIMNIQNQYRHMKILVKQQKSFGAGIEELKKNLEKKSNDVKEYYKEMSTGPTSEEDQRKLSQRVAKLNLGETIYGICLPLPNEFSESQTHNYDTSESMFSDIANKAQPATIKKGVASIAHATGMRKPMIDPGYFADYTGSTPREFSFSWDLVPSNTFEANQIIKIIYHLKKYSLPKSTVSGMSMLSPFMFDVEIGNPHISNMVNLTNVVMKSLSITYAGDGGLSMFADGIPKITTLAITMAERSTVTSDFY